MRQTIVGVMGSGTEPYPDLAKPLGRALAENGFHLLTGGGEGTMRETARAFTSVENRKGLSIGVLPMEETDGGHFEPEDGYPNEFVEICISTPLGSDPTAVSRNYVNILSSDVVVALPGSDGTRNEIDLSLRFAKPIILFGADPATAPAGPEIANTVQQVLEFISKTIGAPATLSKLHRG